MSILIDGYNLMYVFGIPYEGRNARTLHRSRNRLLNRLADALPPDLAGAVTVVFDAKSPPPGVDNTYTHRGMAVLFAVGYEEADDLIEELIQRHSTPKKLVVVSSDHRLQTAATRRNATAVDSEVWFDSLERPQPRLTAPVSAKPRGPLTPDEVAAWLQEFGVEMTPGPETPALEPAPEPASRWDKSPAPPQGKPAQGKPAQDPAGPRDKSRTGGKSPSRPQTSPHPGSKNHRRHPPNRPALPDHEHERDQELWNPFPPGYAEDLLEEDDE
ncbi:NYN domain-containing protein [Lignipirellula cremea]|uniref:YacP-like NYN domain protein n=1 Tax=Lignipirellula cremea TaxID=2528010 RepID=A0A518DPC5_9BACT|nr:NYN domain-containing protein [Lignipirellula cremea]QDU93686.1 YacP-like NYN domain protein [Lignipirellula cremea]